ncbi:transcription termination/antitermination NusG family protein [Sinorhizobium kummerowiae]|uniref:Transcription termination/antitermination NusG family protein n=1 Tax=Sinorhizobium kummerowiae TaxID=158892 RepID=A0ABY8TC62_9HYPH|nr:transcription termination/antitermination NusG family protein [Sinorhizobium kummerowiae]WHS95405.1 transcription termination/antitermination NusG family protein [Sinorhizobium kummerowiae]WRW46553.1 transcription termination/antitermination NusG family protein [Sinorhizobium kummerowiae]
MSRSRWYAIRTAPGYQRMAAVDERLPESRRMESIIERNCRKDGFDIFMPSFYTELRHHRTKQILQKRFPFLVGYAFVNLPRLNFEELRSVEGVVCFLRGANYGPLEFPDSTIEALYFAEHERRQAFLYEQHCRKENERHEQIQHLRGQLRKILPKGRKARVSMVDQAERAIDSLSPQIKERVQKIISELNTLTADAEVENLRKAV